MKSRAENLEFGLLGLLSKGPLHGYELRKRMMDLVGPFRALSFSLIYPQLRKMLREGHIKESAGKVDSRRPRIIYEITPRGLARFSELVESVSSLAWDDEGFEIRFAFFGRTPTKSRIKVLEGRLARLEERAQILRKEMNSSMPGVDRYINEWRSIARESAEREIEWLKGLIANERKTK